MTGSITHPAAAIPDSAGDQQGERKGAELVFDDDHHDEQGQSQDDQDQCCDFLGLAFHGIRSEDTTHDDPIHRLHRSMKVRPATLDDIATMHALRLAVRENRLSDPRRVTPADYERYIGQPGTSWVAELQGELAGFAIADLPSRSIWALFVKPEREGRGVGRALLGQVTESLAAAGPGILHLSTEPGTRAARVYAAAGWKDGGRLANGEIHFYRIVPDASTRPAEAG